MTKRTVLSVLQGTYDKDKFVSQLKEKGIDSVLRYTEEGRIYGATFIDHRTGCVLNGSRMGKELSANALQEHFSLPYAGQELSGYCPPASSHRQLMRPPCATGFPILDFYVQPDAARISVPVPCGCGRCGGDISLNPHPEDVLTDIELQNIARDYLERLGFGKFVLVISALQHG